MTAQPPRWHRPWYWKYYQDSAGKDHLYDLGADLREQADLAPDRPELPAELKASWEKTASGLLPCPRQTSRRTS